MKNREDQTARLVTGALRECGEKLRTGEGVKLTDYVRLLDSYSEYDGGSSGTMAVRWSYDG